MDRIGSSGTYDLVMKRMGLAWYVACNEEDIIPFVEDLPPQFNSSVYRAELLALLHALQHYIAHGGQGPLEVYVSRQELLDLLNCPPIIRYRADIEQIRQLLTCMHGEVYFRYPHISKQVHLPARDVVEPSQSELLLIHERGGV